MDMFCVDLDQSYPNKNKLLQPQNIKDSAQMTDPKDIKVPEEEVYSGVSSDDVEVVNENTKSLLFQMMSQLKIGMDLTRVMIPCDFLEPRSLLEKLTDFMTHGQILHQ